MDPEEAGLRPGNHGNPAPQGKGPRTLLGKGREWGCQGREAGRREGALVTCPGTAEPDRHLPQGSGHSGTRKGQARARARRGWDAGGLGWTGPREQEPGQRAGGAEAGNGRDRGPRDEPLTLPQPSLPSVHNVAGRMQTPAWGSTGWGALLRPHPPGPPAARAGHPQFWHQAPAGRLIHAVLSHLLPTEETSRPSPDLPLPGENDVNALGPWEGALEHSSSPLPPCLLGCVVLLEACPLLLPCPQVPGGVHRLLFRPKASQRHAREQGLYQPQD